MNAPPAIWGTITDIQRFSLNDGPGIRTTVFFKGCNMRCAWCHNPETINPKPELQFFRSKCIDCGGCRLLSESTESEPSPTFTDDAGVKRCYRGNCQAKALVQVGHEVSAQDILSEVLQDRNFYVNSRGGVTLAGGEVTVQSCFAREVLALLKSHGIHTAIETNLAAPWKIIEPLLPLLDLVMFDIKHMDSTVHREWTGIGNGGILENTRRLGAGRLPLIVRTPVIPDFNDNIEAIDAIASFVATLPIVDYYELLPFNPLGADKYRCLGKPYLMQNAPMIPNSRMKELSDAASRHGIKVRIA